MNKLCAHRGPDGNGVYEDPAAQIALGHVRLSVLDLSDAAAQPMIASNNRGVLIFDGEIYNYLELREDLIARGYRFQSSGDTEVLLHGLVEYGEAFLHKLNGMFAFAFWRPHTQELLLARDHIGVKPLYYCEIEPGSLLFSSEFKSFYAHPEFSPQPDFQALQQHLSFCYSSVDRTALLGVKRLPPGHLLRWKGGAFGIECYWRPEYPSRPDAARANPLTLLQAVESSVRRQLVADVPVGVYLSGGLDSSLLTALAARELGTTLTVIPALIPKLTTSLANPVSICPTLECWRKAWA